MNYTEIVKKLIGKIEPIGKTEVDAERLNNLRKTSELISELMIDIHDIVRIYHNCPEKSIKDSVEFSRRFMRNIISNFKDDYPT